MVTEINKSVGNGCVRRMRLRVERELIAIK
jgi:hypothetical protein